jgi:hypothetical protein
MISSGAAGPRRTRGRRLRRRAFYNRIAVRRSPGLTVPGPAPQQQLQFRSRRAPYHAQRRRNRLAAVDELQCASISCSTSPGAPQYGPAASRGAGEESRRAATACDKVRLGAARVSGTGAREHGPAMVAKGRCRCYGFRPSGFETRQSGSAPADLRPQRGGRARPSPPPLATSTVPLSVTLRACRRGLRRARRCCGRSRAPPIPNSRPTAGEAERQP